MISVSPHAASARWVIGETTGTNTAIISMHFDCDGPAARGVPILHLGIWPDGKVVWSTKTNGVRSYFTTNVGPSAISVLLRKFKDRGYFSGSKISRLFYVRIDDCYDSININADGGWLAYDSCVDFTDPKAPPKPDWVMFDHVEAWKWIVTELRAFTPKTGRKLDTFDFRVRKIPE
jgi:hypothetical protein